MSAPELATSVTLSAEVLKHLNPSDREQLQKFQLRPSRNGRDALILSLFMAVATTCWTAYFGAHKDVDMAILMGNIANVSGFVASLILIHKAKCQNVIRLTTTLALVVLSIEVPFYLHHVTGIGWGNAVLPLFATPVLLSYGFHLGRLDIREKAKREFDEVQQALSKDAEVLPCSKGCKDDP